MKISLPKAGLGRVVCPRCGRLLYTEECPEGYELLTTGGPGTELARLLHKLRIEPRESCGCARKARKMNLWGIEGCIERRSEIVGWLKEALKEVNWTERIHVAAALMKTDWFRPRDPLGSIVDESIRRAAQCSSPP